MFRSRFTFYRIDAIAGHTAQLKLSTGLQTKDGILVSVAKRA
jgi:hypothetical protein